MANQHFNFKQFSINQDKCAMKVGTDGVLLGAWCRIESSETILDVGTGTGLIALMLAQRSSADIEAIEIEVEAYNQANENFKNSQWQNRLIIHLGSFENFLPKKKYDLIVSNPPYFSNSYKPSDNSRKTARHTETLNFETLIKHSAKLLNTNGKLAVIIPFESEKFFIETAAKENLFLKHKCQIKPTYLKSPNRLMLYFELNYFGIVEEEILVISESERHHYTQEYKRLTRDFYLNF